jgi:hypothetical protein
MQHGTGPRSNQTRINRLIEEHNKLCDALAAVGYPLMRNYKVEK